MPHYQDPKPFLHRTSPPLRCSLSQRIDETVQREVFDISVEYDVRKADLGCDPGIVSSSFGAKMVLFLNLELDQNS